VGVFLRFLRFGLLAWGGPTAQIAMLRDELVLRERWVDEDRFRRALAVYQALPGPEAHELCCWFGMLARGRVGAIAAGLGFMLPGLLLMLIGAWLYMRFGVRHPVVALAFLAVQAGVIGLMIRAAAKLTLSFARGPILGVVAITGGIAQLLQVPFWIPLLIGGIIGLFSDGRLRHLAPPLLLGGLVLVLFVGSHQSLPDSISERGRTLTVAPPDAGTLLATGLSGGLLSFGGAYTAVPVVRDVAVGPRGWMTDAQFLDGLALGGVLPAPMVIFGTFVGFLGGGVTGALLMTLGIFLPAFSFTLIGHAWFERLVAWPKARAALDGVAASFAGLVVATTLALLSETVRISIDDGFAIGRPWSLALAAAACILFFRLKAWWTIPAILGCCALLGAAVAAFR
jgi:chromate transporter